MVEKTTQIIPKYYGLNNDLVFKYIYGREDNKEYLIDLISEILSIKKDEFINSRITNSVKLNRETISKKGISRVKGVDEKDGIFYRTRLCTRSHSR